MQIIISHNNIKHLEKNNNNKPTENPILNAFYASRW